MKHIKLSFAILLGLFVLTAQAQKTVVGAAKKQAAKKAYITNKTSKKSTVLTRPASAVQNPDGKYPVITFKELSYDFGNINEGDKVEHTFEFTNTGDAPLLISKIKASCGCTIPSNWKKAPILPGEKSSFMVKFNSKNKPNHQTKRIRITSNTKNSNEFVTIKATVKPDPELQKKREERMAKWKRERAARKAKTNVKTKGNPQRAQAVEALKNKINKHQATKKGKVMTAKEKKARDAKIKADVKAKKSSLR